VSERVYATVDKSEWGDGPWQNEPDKIQWRDEATGLPCLVNRGPSGAWCGYVGVPPSHPAYEVDYDDVYELAGGYPDGYDRISVHGGLTYSRHCAHGPEESSICHVPEPGEPDNVWWLGFDCAHSGDLAPRMVLDRSTVSDALEVMAHKMTDAELRATIEAILGNPKRAGYQARRLNVGESLALAALMAEEARRVRA
jgi:hypothetical protein